ncbi:hypothetical protein FRC19_011945 [Serendipita sp. 401]|nr:hypothetical protein FRC19_011945 [Serendipita sp. 401]
MLSVLEDDGTVSSTVRGGAYFPAPDELDPNVEINLSSLRDAPPDGKPLYSYATLIRYAIKGSPEGRLLLEEIYYAIEQRYPYFKTAPAGWKARSQAFLPKLNAEPRTELSSPQSIAECLFPKGCKTAHRSWKGFLLDSRRFSGSQAGNSTYSQSAPKNQKRFW